ncbi:uncharacterized protein LOC144440569 [Glandiceps talaboti]
MDFQFNVNHVLGENDIAVFDERLVPYRTTSSATAGNLHTLIDDMGRASAKAQGLRAPITSASKLRVSNHHLYVMKLAEANRGLGAVIGILKVGRKRLFILNIHGEQTEMEPLCVLDFYVHESCQRKGYGKRLFEHMLRMENQKPQHLAIDRPSPKFTSFLIKHYNLRATIPQVNHFVVFDGFYRGHPESGYVRKRSRFVSNPDSRRPPLPPGGRRDSFGRDPSWNSPGQQNSGTNSRAASGLETGVVRNPVGVNTASRSHTVTAENEGITSDVLSQGLGAQANKYSRYGSPVTTTPPPAPRPGSRTNSFGKADAAVTRYSPITGEGERETNLRTRESTPPPFGRITNFDYNTHLQTQTRSGHLKVSPTATTMTQLPASPQKVNSSPNMTTPTATTATPAAAIAAAVSPLKPGVGQSEESPSITNKAGNYTLSMPPERAVIDSSWNILGVPPRHPTTTTNNPQYYGRGAHWSNKFW